MLRLAGPALSLSRYVAVGVFILAIFVLALQSLTPYLPEKGGDEGDEGAIWSELPDWLSFAYAHWPLILAGLCLLLFLLFSWNKKPGAGVLLLAGVLCAVVWLFSPTNIRDGATSWWDKASRGVETITNGETVTVYQGQNKVVAFSGQILFIYSRSSGYCVDNNLPDGSYHYERTSSPLVHKLVLDAPVRDLEMVLDSVPVGTRDCV